MYKTVTRDIRTFIDDNFYRGYTSPVNELVTATTQGMDIKSCQITVDGVQYNGQSIIDLAMARLHGNTRIELEAKVEEKQIEDFNDLVSKIFKVDEPIEIQGLTIPKKKDTQKLEVRTDFYHIERKYDITDEMGLHARNSSAVWETIKQYVEKCYVLTGENSKHEITGIMSLIQLAGLKKLQLLIRLKEPYKGLSEVLSKQIENALATDFS